MFRRGSKCTAWLCAGAIHALASAQSVAASAVGSESIDVLVTPSTTWTVGLEARRRALRDAVLAHDAQAFDLALLALIGAQERALDAVGEAVRRQDGRVTRRSAVFGVAIASIRRDRLDALADDPAVFDVTPDAEHAACIRHATDNLNHCADRVQATYPGYRGAGACLGLLDSGIDLLCGNTGRPHPAFDRASAAESSRIVGAVSSTPDPNDREDVLGHGSAVGGIAVARDWIPGPEGDDAFAPAADLFSVKITRGGGSTYRDSDLILALDELGRRRLSQSIAVANLSFEGQPNPVHVVQRAIDTLIVDFDVLFVGSAGNLGQLPNPAVQSCGFTNGLAVAAVEFDTHRVWVSSSSGPLPLDPLRTWPDIAACGVGIRAPQRDVPTFESTPLSGTSFAAPMVAGTALVLRGADPNLSALDTKAILLSTTQDISDVNPAGNRYDFGLGLLRTDLAVEALRDATRTRGRARFTAPDLDVPAENAQPGHGYVATLVWNRVDVMHNDLDDLDLFVIDPNGRVVAAAESRRNLYERVVFAATTPGTYLLAVRSVNLIHDDLEWSLVCTENRAGLHQDGTWEQFGSGCDGHGLDPTAGVEFPISSTGRFANNHTGLPLSSVPCRVLQILDGSAIHDGMRIEQIAFRRDDSNVVAPSFDVDLEIRMGHTMLAPLAVQPRFDQNFDGEPVVVFERKLVRLPGVMGLVPRASVFDFVVTLDHPFVAHTGGGRNLVIEFRQRGNSFGNTSFGLDLDAELGAGTALVAAIGDAESVSGQPDPIAISLSLLSGSIGVVSPVITADRPPQIGATMTVTIRSAPPGSMAALVHGGDASNWGGFALPAAFDPIAAPGCALAVRPDIVLSTAIAPTGQGSVVIHVPATPQMLGEVFFEQFLVLDRAANALGVTSTAAARARVGG
ncbi:MAG: S8 family serine peptidase [Planctomycetota bacterium]